MRVFLVDDEPLAVRQLELLLREAPGEHDARAFTDPREALAAALAEPPELIVLDVRMPGLHGMSFLAALHDGLEPARRPCVVLASAHPQFAVDAFAYEALDYLLKPVDPERFARALSRARERLAWRASRGAEHAPADAEDTLQLQAGGRRLHLAPTEILWVEAAGHYLLIHTARSTHLVRERMGALQDRLGDDRFVRIHRGALVHRAAVRSHGSARGGKATVELRDGTRLDVSRRRWPEVRAALDG